MASHRKISGGKFTGDVHNEILVCRKMRKSGEEHGELPSVIVNEMLDAPASVSGEASVHATLVRRRFHLFSMFITC